MSVFSTLWSKIKEVIQQMIGSKTVESVLQIKPAISDDMANAIQLWGKMYQDDAPWLHEPTPEDTVAIRSLGLPALIASEKTRTALLEFQSEITTPTEEVEEPNPDYTPTTQDAFGNEIPSQESETIVNEVPVSDTARAEFLNEQYEKFKKQLRTHIEYGVAKGGIVVKPYVIKSEMQQEEQEEGTAGQVESTQTEQSEGTEATVQSQEQQEPQYKYDIEFDWVQADGFFPLAFDGSGRMTEAAFVQRKVDKDTIYSRLEYHKYENGKVTVKNRAFKTSSSKGISIAEEDLGKEIPLTDVPEWSNIAPEAVINYVDRLMFAYFKMPEANTIDPYSNLGVSGYSRACSLIKQADIQYSRLLWEYEAGEMAVNVDRDAFTYMADKDGVINAGHSELPIMQQRLFRQMDVSGEELFQPYSPALRDVSYLQGLNTLLMRIEDVTGLSRGTISDASQEARTATEIKLLKQRSFQSNQDIQMAIQNMIEDVIYIMNAYCDLYQITPYGEYDTSFEWDDSILVDREAELNKQFALMDRGITSRLEVRMWYYGETERQAREKLAEIDSENEAAVEQNMIQQMQMSNIVNNSKEG